MNSNILKRSIILNGHKTSVSLEDCFWNALKEIAAERNVSASTLICSIDGSQDRFNLSSCIRQFVFAHYQSIAGVSLQDAPRNDGRQESAILGSQHVFL